MKPLFSYVLTTIGILFLLNQHINSQVLYVGANYHPHDLISISGKRILL